MEGIMCSWRKSKNIERNFKRNGRNSWHYIKWKEQNGCILNWCNMEY